MDSEQLPNELIVEIRSTIASLIACHHQRRGNLETIIPHQAQLCRTLSDLLEELQEQHLPPSSDGTTNSNTLTRTSRQLNHNQHAGPSFSDNNQKSSMETHFIRTNLEYNNALLRRKGPSIRDALGTKAEPTVLSLIPILSSLMAHRVDTESILPATQDEQANLAAMDDTMTAITLTPAALAAAQVFTQLLVMPGAWGSGLNDMEALSSLAGIIRRWSVECRGREQGITSSIFANKKRNAKQSRKRRADVMEHDTEEYDSVEGGDQSFLTSTSALSPRALLLSGLETARVLGMIPRQAEFMSWSYESREVLLDAIVCSLATASALTAKSRGNKEGMDNKIQEWSHAVVAVASDSLARCISIAWSQQHHNDKDQVNSCFHETAVLILRGLTPFISTKGDTPNGEAGKQAAHSAALYTLENLVKAVTQNFSISTAASSVTATPRQVLTTTTRTPLPSRGSRRSLAASFGEIPTPAALKASATPRRRCSMDLNSTLPCHRPRPVLSAIVGMFQKLATTHSSSMERVNIREGVIATLIRCMPHLPCLEREHLIRFFTQMCQSKVPVHRLLGVEVVGAVLAETWFWKDHSSTWLLPQHAALSTPYSVATKDTSASSPDAISPRNVAEGTKNIALTLFGALEGRMLDRAPTVRARAAVSLTNLFRSLRKEQHQEQTAHTYSMRLHDCVGKCANSLHEVLSTRALNDNKATVRKASIDAFVELLLFCEVTELNDLRLTAADATVLECLSSNTSLITRKAAVDGITILLQKCSESEMVWRVLEEKFEKAWLMAILPMMLDVETSCASKAVELFTKLVIQPILDGVKTDKDCSQSAWRLLSSIGDMSGNAGAATKETQAIKAALVKLRTLESTKGEVTLKLMQVICQVASTTLDSEPDILFQPGVECQRTGVWCLFDALVDDPNYVTTIAILVKKRQIDVDFVAIAWQGMMQLLLQQTTLPPSKNKLRGSMRSCLRILSKLASCIGNVRAKDAAKALTQLLHSLSAPTEVAGFAISSVVAIMQSVNRGEPFSVVKKECKDWIASLLNACESIILKCLQDAGNDGLRAHDEVLLARALFICGELSMIGFCLDEDALMRNASATKERHTSDAISGLHVPPSSNLVNLVMALISKTLPTDGAGTTPDAIRALAYVTFGKFCLRDEDLAKQSIPIFAGQLYENIEGSSSSVQSNALLIMGDLCVRYTNMVDRYLPVMAACLQFGMGDDDDKLFDERPNVGAIVRKHAVVLLSNLLLQDYIKWRGLLFHRFLVTCADRDDEVANLAAATLCGPLLSKYPKLFFNQFVESLFVLNRCTAHPIYKAAAATGDGGAGVAVGFDGINLTGKTGRIRRHQMYGMLLSKLTDEEKIGVTARIAKEVLGAAIEGEGDLGQVCRESSADKATSERDDGAREVLRDAFAILTPMLRIRHSSTAVDDLDDSNVSSTSQRVAVAKTRLLSKISSKQLIEIILPKLCNLKAVMQASYSPLLKDLMGYLVAVFRAYKSEVKEFLSGDPVLLQEIEYDARNFKTTQDSGENQD